MRGAPSRAQPGGKRPVQIVPAARAVNVERLARGVQSGHAAALHRFAVKFGDIRAAARHLRVLRVAGAEDRKPVILDNAGKLRRLAASGAARYRLAEPPVENAGEQLGAAAAQRLLCRELRGERVQRQLRQQIERERVARKGVPREIQRKYPAHAEIPEKNFAVFGINALSAAEKLRAAGAAQPRETADGFRVGLERTEDGGERNRFVPERAEKRRAAAGGSDHAVGEKRLAGSGGENKAAALRSNGGDLGGAALLNAQRLAAETQHVEHGGGGVAARINAPLLVRDRP